MPGFLHLTSCQVSAGLLVCPSESERTDPEHPLWNGVEGRGHERRLGFHQPRAPSCLLASRFLLTLSVPPPLTCLCSSLYETGVSSDSAGEFT